MRAAAMQREWRQFVLLSRDSVRRLLNSALWSGDGDAVQLSLWAMTALVIPPSIYAFNQILRYTAMGARWRPEFEQVVLADRMFFVLYGMVASALLAAVLWEALLPDATDQEVVGVLPVRDRTLTAARLAGAVMIGFAFAMAVAAPAAVIFGVISTTHPAFGWLPIVVVTHVGSVVAGSMWTFGLLLLGRVSLAVVFGTAVSERLALGLQVLAIALIVTVFFFLPGVLSWLVQAAISGGATSTLLVPPIWFGALYAWASGMDDPTIAQAAGRAAVAIGLVGGLIVPSYLSTATLIARRVRESRGRRQSSALPHVLSASARLIVRRIQGRAIVAFTLISLVRSHRHLLVVMSYLGAGIALGAGRLVTAELLGPFGRPSADAPILLVPLVLMLVLVIGLRTAFALPTDLDANWPFRLASPTERTARRAVSAVFVIIAIAGPVLAFAIVAAAAGWSVAKIAIACGFEVTTGLVLVTMALRRWARVPFACGVAPRHDTANVRWLQGVLLMGVFGFFGAQIQEIALRSRSGATIYMGVVVASAIVLMWRYRGDERPVEFDARHDNARETLGLSEALS